MKKLIMALCFISICGVAWSAPDLSRTTQYVGSQKISTGRAVVWNAVVSYKGVTVGDYIQFIDGTTGSGTVDLSIYAATANGSISIPDGLVGMSFDTGLYLNEVKSGGAFYTSIQQ